jgi:cytosine/adenosine deaminase-related metal-dependent hydrolase
MAESDRKGPRIKTLLVMGASLVLLFLGYTTDRSEDDAVLVATVAGVASTVSPPPAQPAGTVAFVGVNVIPMDQERVLENQTVLVAGGLVRQMGGPGEVEVPGDAEVVEARGLFLMPGLAEMHAHVPPGDRPAPGVLEDIMFLYLANGITTIRGMLGSDYQLGLREELASGRMVGPTLYAAAPSLNGNTARTPEEAEERIRQYADAGYDLLKIHPGITLPVWDHMAAIANEVGVTFGGHVPVDVGLFHALETGQSTVDHLDGMLEASVSAQVRARSEAGEDVPMEEVLASIDADGIAAAVRATREAGAWVVPTSYLWMNLLSPVNVDSMLALPEMRYVSQRQREGWRNQKNNSGSQPAPVATRIVEVRDRILAEANRQGLGILMGTDSPQLFNVPGFALHREIRFMERAGMTPFEVLASGTRNVARYVAEDLGQPGNFGVIAPGNRADLVLLEANPLESLDALTQRAGVMVRGRWIPGSDLEAGLAALAAKHAN